MAEKYNLPSHGTRPQFFRLPGGRGGTQSGLSLPAPPSRPPPAVLNGQARAAPPQYMCAMHGHIAMISPIVIKTIPTAHFENNM